MNPRPETASESAAYVEEQMRRMRETVVPLAEHDSLIASLVRDGRRLAEHLQATTARTPGEAAAVGHSLISLSGELASVIAFLRSQGEHANQAATLVNLLGVVGYYLIDGAQAAQDAEVGR